MANSYKIRCGKPSGLRHLLRVLSLTFLALLLYSCQEGREAGDLLGQWRLKGSDHQYVAFSGAIVVFRTTNTIPTTEVYGNFQHKGDSLYIQCFSKEGGYRQDTLSVEQGFGFRPFHDIRLKVVNLDDDNLMVTQGQQKWHFTLY